MRKFKHHRKPKFRLLLDSAFAKTSAFPRLRKKTNLAHAVHDLKLPLQAEDKDIYSRLAKATGLS